MDDLRGHWKGHHVMSSEVPSLPPSDAGLDRRAFIQRLMAASAVVAGAGVMSAGPAAASPRVRPVVDLYADEMPDASRDPIDLTNAQAALLLRRGTISPVELAERRLARIAKLDSTYMAWNTVQGERALARARRLQRSSSRNALFGIPPAIKDNFFTQGVRTTANSFTYKDFVPTFDATVVTRLQQVGGIVLGKTQMGPLETTRATTPDGLVTTVNAWAPNDPAVYPGGSSTGSATAVAGWMATSSIGTQTGGSITNPALAQGLTGLKPTMGRCSLFGVIPLTYTRDHPGPIARDIKDAAIMLQSMAGPDEHDARTLGLPEVADLVAPATPVRRGKKVVCRWPTRLGVFPDFLSGTGPAADLRRAMLDSMSSLGIRVVPIEPPDEWCILSGHAFNSVRLPERSEAFLECLQSDLKLLGVSLATWMQGLFLGGDEYVRGQRAKHMLVELFFARVFDRCDVVLQGSADAFDFIGFPLIAFPIGLVSNADASVRLPEGAILGGQPYAEDRICAVAAAYQAVTDHHRLGPPEPGTPSRSQVRVPLRLSREEVESRSPQPKARAQAR